MPKPAAISNTSIARFLRVVGRVNLVLAITCIATPSIRSYSGEGMALLLAVGLLTGAALMGLVAQRFDARPRWAFATLRDSIWQLGGYRLSAT